jgi:hypothetical protein
MPLDALPNNPDAPRGAAIYETWPSLPSLARFCFQVLLHRILAAPNQLLRGFVEAYERTLRIVRPLIDLQHVFHVGDKGRAGVRRDHPLLLAMRFENVFLASARSCSTTSPGLQPEKPYPNTAELAGFMKVNDTPAAGR